MNELRDKALSAVGEYIGSRGWTFGGDQADFMWCDPISSNWHHTDDAFGIQLDRDMIETINRMKRKEP